MFTPSDHTNGLLTLDFLDTVGDGSGTINMAVDGSSTPVEFSRSCPPNHVLQLETVGVHLEDNGAFSAGNYGSVPPLTNGLRLEFRQDTGTFDITNQLPIRANSHWLAYTFDVSNFDFSGGTSILSLNYNLNVSGRPIRLAEGESFTATVRDDLSSMGAHYIRISYVLHRIRR